MKVGLYMNFKKTYAMSNKYVQNRGVVIKLGNEEIEHVNNYFNKPFHGGRDQAQNHARMPSLWKDKFYI